MGHILIVDDNSELREPLKIYLTEKGHQVEEAENGQEALKLTAKKTFDVILLDIRMPDHSGSATYTAIRTRDRKEGKEPPKAIIMTAYPHDQLTETLKKFSGGIVSMVEKPFAFGKLEQEITKLLKG